jgi:hypothetical protein
MNIGDHFENKSTTNVPEPILAQPVDTDLTPKPLTTIGAMVDPSYQQTSNTPQSTQPSSVAGVVLKIFLGVLLFNMFISVFSLLKYNLLTKSNNHSTPQQPVASRSYPEVRTQSIPPSTTGAYVPLASISQVATSTWSSMFSISDVTQKDDTYALVYFDRLNPARNPKIATSKNLSFSYDVAASESYPASTDNLAVYVAGNKIFATSTNYTIKVDAGWSRFRLLIDKRVVLEGTQHKQQSINLTPGRHFVEMEFISGWHVPEFSVVFLPE